ncbi:APC family permease [Kineococcus rhizosphaerae]|uniref:Amino acid/polyamine/organocation transporter (APC superfamily) n=1 Tax=Kineococcus rhizosphaerae TaxID=559628 RepID=A0A2T0R191_9ACTN|nr:APC family permease [Kineococcus rhizosphaerae]PRY13040.1 amino acid/polyamine/organocation transporter (APC superfamily) [Kineococcus rhizosphaerae]
MTASAPLARRLGRADAVVIGLGSMLGAGVFAAFTPAAAAAGPGLLLGLVLAAVVAWCNATATAQLAAAHPSSGGAYLYGRERLGERWGFLAGWGFVVGKTASCAAMATTFAAHVVPGPWQRPAAALAVVALAVVNHRGITRTARLTRVLLAVTLSALAVVVVASLVGAFAGDGAPRAALDLTPLDVPGVLQSAGLLFFAFAGYARVATLGEEVRDPARTIPWAVTVALACAVVVYALVGVAVLAALGADRLATQDAPLVAAAGTAGWGWTSPLVRAGAAAAALGALLGLVAGVGRTSLAVARNGDLPRALAAVHPRYAVPHRAQALVAVVVGALVLSVDLRSAIGFSSFGVLVYYLVANVAAWTQPREQRRFPRALQVIGAAGCVALVAALPARSVAAGILVFAVGFGYRSVHARSARRRRG